MSQAIQVISLDASNSITQSNKKATSTSNRVETEIEYEIEIDPNDPNINEAIRKAIEEQEGSKVESVETRTKNQTKSESSTLTSMVVNKVAQNERDLFEVEKSDSMKSINIAQQEIKTDKAFIQKERQQLINDKAAFDIQKNELNQAKAKLVKEKAEFEVLSKNYQSNIDAAIADYEAQISEKIQEYIDENTLLKNEKQSLIDQLSRITAERDFLRVQRAAVNKEQTIETLQISTQSVNTKKSTSTVTNTTSVEVDIEITAN